ncbi:MAG: TrkA family potassium uptake protein [Oscillospiraceae bacterium]|jgi:trk system potassium uptake protein TrkA|nr:TrkA family potassium uptake protein [Oscillospiraceae bacterium]MBQ2382971.1 TrkA family potassium uptake protein [Oscillospiraceae bacterium]MBQ5712480.1 TrkA family potassium uptake protein [Oscillospiraceae bacterium]
MRSYVVIGLGRFGSEVARELYRQGCEVLALDMSSELVAAVADEVTHAVVADAQDKDVLRALGVAEFDCAIVAIGSDLAASVLTTMNLKELGLPQVVCKAHGQVHRRVLEKLGADRVLVPEQEQAVRLARSLSSPNVLDYIELSDDYGIVEVPVPAAWVGKDLRELNIRAKLGLNVLAIRRAGEIIVSPAADLKIGSGDVVVVLGDSQALRKVRKL